MIMRLRTSNSLSSNGVDPNNNESIREEKMARQSCEAKQELDLNVKNKSHNAMSRVRDVSFRLGHQEPSLLADAISLL